MHIPYEILLLILCAVVATVYIVQPNYSATNSETAVIPFKEKDKVLIYTATTYFSSKIEERWTLYRCPSYMASFGRICEVFDP